jgi:hypothetical protein
MTSGEPQFQQTDPRAIEKASRIIAQALLEAEVVLGADREAAAERRGQTIPQPLLEMLERFSDVLTRLVEHTEHLANSVADLTEAVSSMADASARGAAPQSAGVAGVGPKPQLPEMEPSFAPGGEGVDVSIAAVPGFQGLMEVQKALVTLPQVQSAAVRRYQDEEAAIQLILRQPMSATQVAEAVSGATGKQLIVDDARPELLRLRLRFLG